MKKLKIYDCVIWIATAVLVGLTFTLSDTVPIHWNSDLQVDGYGSRYTFLLLALLPIMVYYGMLLTRFIDPKKKNFEGREKVFDILRRGLSAFFVILAGFFYYLTLHPTSDFGQLLMILMGILMMGIGNYMPKVPQNYYIGIKTSWALSSEYVWKKTHKVGGYCFALCGMVMILLSFLNLEGLFGYMMVLILLNGAFTVFYSYITYQNKPKDID